ncbi:MAG: sialidase family protein [Mycobacteriales bacterium]
MTSSAVRAMLAAGLLTVAAGLALIGGTAPAAGATVVTRGLPVNASAADAKDFSAHNSPVVTRHPTDPRMLALVNRVDAPVFSCAMHTSADGGASWQARPIPFPAGEEQPERCYAPDAGFGPDGTLYLFFVTLKGFGNTPNAGWTVSSTDLGQTFSVPRKALGPLAFQARLAADPEQAGRLWLTWLQVGQVGTFAFPQPGNPILAARSDDGGATWSPPEQVSPPSRERVLAPSVAVAGDRLSVLYLDIGRDSLDYAGAHEGRGGEPYPGPWSLMLARSADAGATWSQTVVEDAVVPAQRFVVFIPPAPSLAVGGERVHVAFSDARLGDPDVRVWTSTDGGASFGPGRRVNDTPEGDGTAQYLPRLGLAPDGRLDVVYYDRRVDPDDANNEVSLQSSTDGGASFGPRMLLSDRSFDARIGPGSERGLTDLGSGLGLVSGDERALAVWTDTRAGTEASGKQDLARAVVVFQPPSALRGALPWLAGLVAVAAVGLLSVRPRRRTAGRPAGRDRVTLQAASHAGGRDGS